MDAWFKEAAQGKDPHKRINVVDSPRPLRVEVNGVEVANTTKPRLLFEGSIPPRIYIPKDDCHMEFLKSTELTTHCPYKGNANYYTVQLPSGDKFDNIVWWYGEPSTSDAAGIKGYVSFYDTKVDLYLDGALQARP
ncbi:uncharacterized protein B0H18DRAFT_994815 [Fomitopsis serialis]|uniref:uncharacterized protein n=1 Tax=Fomitopsis serialis TaxID=139415 RepID=UPI002008CF8D|nr:uncharacterized protein B0H18DRAFT_994815 [Neoantrodia serialis]KAH9930017.1 hypothetical protein B0H18DRAFT_994815 [Neoantrodia serialis]